MSERIQARVEWLLVALGVVVVLFGASYYFSGDGYGRSVALVRLADAGQVEPMKWSFVGPLGAWPLYLLGETLDGLFAGQVSWWHVGSARDGWNASYQLMARYNAFLWLAGIAVLAWALRGVVADTVRRRCVLLLLAGSLASNHLRFFHGEVFTTVLVGVGLVVIYRAARGAWAWGAVVLGVLNTPASLPALGLLALRRLWEQRRLRYLLLPPLALGLILLEQRWRLGHWGATGYEDDHGVAQILLPYSGRPGFSYPFFFGLLGLLLSFGKGLVWFAPGLLLPAWRRLTTPAQAGLRACYWQWLLFLGALVLVYAKWWSWYGGWSFGPRFLVFAALPASLALALYLERPSARLRVNLAVLAALLLSLWVGACGAVFDMDDLDIGKQGQFAYEVVVWHVPEWSVLWHPFIAHRALDWHDYLTLGYGALLALVLGAAHALAVARDLAARGGALWHAARMPGQWRV